MGCYISFCRLYKMEQTGKKMKKYLVCQERLELQVRGYTASNAVYVQGVWHKHLSYWVISIVCNGLG